MNNIIEIKNGKLAENAVALLIQKEQEAKRAKEEYDALKEELLTAMEEYNVVKIDTPELLVNYIAPSESERLDSKALKDNCPDLYNEFVKFVPVKASVRIKVK